MNPYSSLPQKHFWSPAVGKKDVWDIEQLWKPKRMITRGHKISTYGSCFAQYFGNALAARNYQWMRYENPPIELSDENAIRFNYGVFSARTANIYTASLLKQWTLWALGKSKPPTEVWYKNGRFYDPFRPTIEPNGFATEQEVHDSRELTIEAFRASFMDANLFVFTLGLTESWKNKDGYEYPMCPGTAAGAFNENRHIFHNQQYEEIKRDLLQATQLMIQANPNLRFLLTVSPVPLTATMSGNHVLTATVESKSILRAVAGDLARNKFHYDYFPSYEIISSTPFQGMFYNENKRTVKMEGVNFVMSSFFNCLEEHFGGLNTAKIDQNKDKTISPSKPKTTTETDPVCEEQLLGAFSTSENNNQLDIAS